MLAEVFANEEMYDSRFKSRVALAALQGEKCSKAV
jgi:hypothetical protein